VAHVPDSAVQVDFAFGQIQGHFRISPCSWSIYELKLGILLTKSEGI